MRKYLLFIMLVLASVAGYGQTDEEFKQLMQKYEQRLKAVKTRREGETILAEMQAKQQEYLKKKMQPVNDIKARYGVDQATSAAKGMIGKSGTAKYENNPLYIKCRVEMTYNYSQDDVSNGPRGPSTFKANGNCSLRADTYLFTYLDQIVLEAQSDAMTNKSITASLSDRGSSRDGNGSYTYQDQASAISDPSPGITLHYQSPTNWSAGGKVYLKGTHSDNVNPPVIDTPDIYQDVTNDNGHLMRDGNKFIITRTISEHTQSGSGEKLQKHNLNGSLKITITPIEDDYTAYFEPVAGQAAYEQWMPEGYRSKVDKHGNFIDIKIKVDSKKHPNDDFTSQIKYVIWELPTKEVSRVPGYACNAPTEWADQVNAIDDEINRKADMQLRRVGEKPDTAVETLIDTTTVNNNNNTIRVYSFDWGGYANLKAHVFFMDGSDTYALTRTQKADFMTLPLRDGDSKVATYFKKINKVLNKKDTDDDEKIMEDDKYPGDGFTVYEEYRGFIENNKHIFGDPNAKDVMIYDGIKTNRVHDGIAMYEMLLNNYTKQVVKTHYKFTTDEFGIRIPDPTASEEAGIRKYGVKIIRRDKRLNFNNVADLHNVDQHGICILNTDWQLGYAIAVQNNEREVCGPPKEYDFLVISASFSPKYGAWSTVKVDLHDDGTFTVNPNGKGVIKTDEYARVIAHEMLHNSGVNHHGNDDAYGSDPSRFDYVSNGVWQINKGSKAQLHWETTPNQVIDDHDLKFKELLRHHSDSLMIRTFHGVCSGVEDCLMRYDDAFAYAKDANAGNIYIMGDAEKHYHELTGIHLCNSQTGTGVNDKSRGTKNRYGDADMGDCIHQYCINDKYAH